MNSTDLTDVRLAHLRGGFRQWYDTDEQRFIDAATAYVPYGCPDWGETDGERNDLCAFCALPNAVAEYRVAFYRGNTVPHADHLDLFRRTLRLIGDEKEFHTLMIFNAGSFLAMPVPVQQGLFQAAMEYPFMKRIVIEARAPLITDVALRPLLGILEPFGVKLTVRVGVETSDDHLRLKVLKKGHSRGQLEKAAHVMRNLGVTSGGYVLLNPAPGLERAWAKAEAITTIEWVLDREQGLGMDEVYFGPTCVGQNTALARHWEDGSFTPADLHAVLEVLHAVLPRHHGKLHLLPFVDEPPFLAVPSNHVPRGLPQSLEGALGCDMAYHRMFDAFRTTHDPSLLHMIPCSCISR
jgi:radical SAM enzyme (TIGR01210 family)